MKRAIVTRGMLIASLGLYNLLASCTKDDCEQETLDDKNLYLSQALPKTTPAIRCHVVLHCPDPYAPDGKEMRSFENVFKIRDEIDDTMNKKKCEDRFDDGIIWV